MALKTGIVGLPNVGKARGCAAAHHHARRAF
jgi:ribosome-binding ATPase YchF (GTP1/OBG family)